MFLLPDRLLSYIFFKTCHREVCEAYPKIWDTAKIVLLLHCRPP